MLARVENEAVVEIRNITIQDVPEHKRSLWVPVVYEGEGPNSETIVEPDRVRIVRSKPVPTANTVRAEASRRMQAAFGARDAAHLDIIIANAMREVARLSQVKIGVPHPEGGWLVEPREWTPEERQRLAELHAADRMMEAIRAASNTLEADPPADFADDRHWK